MSALFLLSGLQVGGTESKTVKISNELVSRGNKISLAYLKGPEHLLRNISDDIIKTCLHRRGKFSLRALRNLKRFVREQQVDTIICMNEYPMLYASVLKLFFGCKNVRVVLAINTTDFKRFRDRLFMLVYSWLIRRIDTVIYGCEYQMRVWQERYGLAGVDSRVIYNGVDLERFCRDRVGEDLREHLGITDSFVIGFVGRLESEKNPSALLPVAAALNSDSRCCDVLFVGDGPERQALVESAQRLGIDSNVHFAGRLSDVRTALMAMDVFVLPSIAVETFSNAALEAMAMSLPVVLSDIGGAREMILDGVSGYVYKKDDEERLKEIVLSLYRDKDLREEVGRSAREAALQQFDICRMFEAYQLLLDGA